MPCNDDNDLSGKSLAATDTSNRDDRCVLDYSDGPSSVSAVGDHSALVCGPILILTDTRYISSEDPHQFV